MEEEALNVIEKMFPAIVCTAGRRVQDTPNTLTVYRRGGFADPLPYEKKAHRIGLTLVYTGTGSYLKSIETADSIFYALLGCEATDGGGWFSQTAGRFPVPIGFSEAGLFEVAIDLDFNR